MFRTMCAYAFPALDQEKQLIKAVISILANARQPLPPSKLLNSLRLKVDLLSILKRYPDNFECFEDRQLYVRLITKVSICETHCSKGKNCPGKVPFCTGLHICKFYILSGKCKFTGQCSFGHDLTTSHNQSILKENLLDGLSVEDVKFLLKQTQCRTAVTIPRICRFYNVEAGCRNDKDGKTCPNLHICKHYIESSCRFGRNCRRSHDILNKNVKDILEKHGINTRRTPKEIMADLQEAISSVKSDAGSTGSAEMLDDMCQPDNYRGRTGGAQNQVPWNAMKPQPGPLKASHSVPVDINLPSLPLPPSWQERPGRPSSRQRTASPMTRHRSASGQRKGLGDGQETDQNSQPMVCIFNLRGKCAFAENCRNFHGDLPYQWQYKGKNEKEWREVPENLQIELTYTDPNNQEFFMALNNAKGVKVMFRTMSGLDALDNEFDVQRLSTSSSVEFVQRPLTTVWIWYWRGQTGNWKKYGEDDGGYKATISCSELEQAYISNPDGHLTFSTLGHEYVLDFQKMLQRNLQYKTEREVCRRPKFMSRQDVQDCKNQSGKGAATRGAQGVGQVAIPTHWNLKSDEDISDHLVIATLAMKNPLNQKEYKDIEGIFCESMPSTVSIKSIERIENGELWCNYDRKKAKMMKKKGGKDVGERRLFHGTQTKYVDAICIQGFDFRLSGQTSGARFGKGSYFATTSKYCDYYTDKADKAMFVVKVLVGEFVQGKSDYVRPPSKDENKPFSDLYDSCVNNENNPTIFVIFDNSGQVYPEYLIRYEYKY